MILLALVIWAGLQNYTMVLLGIQWVIGLAFPFILGGCMAFIINIPMNLFENKVFLAKGLRDKPLLKKIRRPLSLVLALLAILALLFIVSFLIVPEIANTALIIKEKAPSFIAHLQQQINGLQSAYPEIAGWLQNISLDWDNIEGAIIDFAQKGVMNFLGSTVNVASSIAGGFVNFGIGLIFAIYVLLQKEKLGIQFRKLLYAYAPEKRADHTVDILKLSATTFTNFITGQCTEAVIIGCLFFVTMSIFRFPYALMVSVLIAFLSLIPIFGAFIGCAVGAFLILMVSPVQAFWFIVLFLVVQQLEGNLIYPHVVGGSVGLPSIWVLAAVTVGGSAWGITGMILTIPICSILYTLLREDTRHRLSQRHIQEDKLGDF